MDTVQNFLEIWGRAYFKNFDCEQESRCWKFFYLSDPNGIQSDTYGGIKDRKSSLRPIISKFMQPPS